MKTIPSEIKRETFERVSSDNLSILERADSRNNLHTKSILFTLTTPMNSKEALSTERQLIVDNLGTSIIRNS